MVPSKRHIEVGIGANGYFKVSNKSLFVFLLKFQAFFQTNLFAFLFPVHSQQ